MGRALLAPAAQPTALSCWETVPFCNKRKSTTSEGGVGTGRGSPVLNY